MATPIPTKSRTYLVEIDGLRAIAVLAVILFHFDFSIDGGFVGVDVFFVISGFLISTILLKELNSASFSLLGFYMRRVRRLAPALIAMSLGTVIAAWFIVLPDDFARLGSALVSQPLFLSNFYHWRNTDYFSPSKESFPLLHTWSLAVEEQFYLFFPIALVLIHRCCRQRLWLIAVVLFLVSMSLGIWTTSRFPKTAFYLLPFRAWELILGMMVAMMDQIRFKPIQNRIYWSYELGSILGMLAIAVSIFSFRPTMDFPGFIALIPCGGTALFIGCNSSQLTRSGSLLASYPIALLGRMSYSLYLVHWPVLVLYQYWHFDESGWKQRTFLLGLTLLLGTLSYLWVETPFRRKKICDKEKNLMAFVVCASLVMVFAGFAIRRNNGFEGRFDPLVLKYHSARNNIQRYEWVTPLAVSGRRMPVLGDSNGQLKVLLWGDSHAFTLIPVIDSICRDIGLKGVQATYARTAPLLGFTSTDEMSLRGQSRDYSQSVVEAAVDLKLEIVVLASYWSYYPFDSQVEKCIETTVDAFIEKGIRVIILRDIANTGA